jgi:hypothetical protein
LTGDATEARTAPRDRGAGLACRAAAPAVRAIGDGARPRREPQPAAVAFNWLLLLSSMAS